MSDETGLLTRVENFLDAHERMTDPPLTLNAAVVFIRALRDELHATEAERKHHEMTSGCIRTDLEYMTRDSERAGELYQDIGRQLNEAIARAEQAEARLAEYERWKGDAEKVIDELMHDPIDKAFNMRCHVADKDDVLETLYATKSDAVSALISFATQAAARQREEDAKIADAWATDEQRKFGNGGPAAAIRKGETTP